MIGYSVKTSKLEMTDDPILQALGKIVRLYDGVAESAEPHALHALLPDGVARSLGVDEEVTFTTSAAVRDACFVTYHSELLKKCEALLDAQGYVSALGIKYHGHLKTAGFDKAVAEAVRPLNGLLRVHSAQPAVTPYLLCNIAYTANADERRLGMVSFFLNELTGVAPVGVGNALAWETDRIAANEHHMRGSLPFGKLLKIIQNAAVRLIDGDIGPWRQSLNRKQRRDEERLQAYYTTIEQEIKYKISRRHLTGEDEQRELARIAATQAEQQRKLADIRERYALTIEAQLHSALRVQLATTHISCELVRKKHQRLVTVVWNPFSRQVEPLRCERSDVPVSTFFLSDEDAKIIAPAAWD